MPEPVTEPPDAGETFTFSFGRRNEAPTVAAPETVKAQEASLSDEQAPLQALNAQPEEGEAVSVSGALLVTVSLQSPVVPAPQAIPGPVTEPFVGLGEMLRITRSSSILSSAPRTFSSCSPSVAEPLIFTVSPPSETESAIGLRTNVLVALRSPPGMESAKLETAAKSVPSVAVPPFTFTATDFDADETVRPVSCAFTRTVRAPPSSGTDEGRALSRTFGSQVAATSRCAAVRSPLKAWVTRRRYLRVPGASENAVFS